TDFEDGIVMTIDWYLNNSEWMDNVTNGSYLEYYNEMYSKK
ncbi:MAG: dTDP-glucose 4,6-dehydratase, partial [Oscillospiraceae bacterium]